MRTFFVYVAPALIWMGIIFYFSSLPRVSVSDAYTINFLFFKSLHVIEYGVLYVLLYRAFKQDKRPRTRYFVWAFITALLYALSDEYHQSFSPGRSPSVRDVVIDFIGMSVAYWILRKRLITV